MALAVAPPTALGEVVKALMAKKVPLTFDLTEAGHHEHAYECAEQLQGLSIAKLRALDSLLMKTRMEFPVSVHMAVKLAKARLAIEKLSKRDAKYHVTFVVPMYKESSRIYPKTEDNPNGEDFLRRKVKQVSWALGKGLSDEAQFTWRLLFVDDGCPNESGKLAADMIAAETKKDAVYQNCHVEFLQNAIDEGIELFSDILTTKDSIKGGAVTYGFWAALNRAALQRADIAERQHVVCFTDSDLSSDIGMIGLLLQPLFDSDAKLAIADRYNLAENALYCGSGGAVHLVKYDVVNLALRCFFRSKLLSPMRGLVDSQCGFKAMRAETVATLLPLLRDRKHTIDMELIILLDKEFAATSSGAPLIASVPLVWTESVAESAFWAEVAEGPSETSARSYFKMVKLMVALSEKWGVASAEPRMLEFIKAMSFEDYFAITKHMYGTVTVDLSMGEWKATVDEMQKWIAATIAEETVES